MKKVFFSFLISFNIFACELPASNIAGYDHNHKEAVCEMIMQQQRSFFLDAHAVEMGLITEENFMIDKKRRSLSI